VGDVTPVGVGGIVPGVSVAAGGTGLTAFGSIVQAASPTLRRSSIVKEKTRIIIIIPDWYSGKMHPSLSTRMRAGLGKIAETMTEKQAQ
jgi:hypothetical protein